MGPAAAARAYFNKRPINLALSELIYLAGLPQAPTRFNPLFHIAAAERMYRRSLIQLSRGHALQADQMTLAADVPRLAVRRHKPRSAPHFIDAILTEKNNCRQVFFKQCWTSICRTSRRASCKVHRVVQGWPQYYLNALVSDDRVRIVSPARDATFMINPTLPILQQHLQLTALANPAEDWVSKVDGRQVPSTTNCVFWPLVPGSHVAEVHDTGHTDAVKFTVE